MSRPLAVVAVAIVCALVLVSRGAPAAQALAPTAPSQTVVLLGQGTCSQGSTAFTTRVLPDGSTAPFTIPKRQVLVLTSVTWGASNAGSSNTNFFELSVDDGQQQHLLNYQTYAQSDASGYVGRDAALPHLVVKSGLRLCGQPLVGITTTATVTGFLAKDK